jgi:hypothetical protein
MYIKIIFNPFFFPNVFHFYLDLDVLMSCKQELFHLDTATSNVSNQFFDFNHVFTKRHSSNDNHLVIENISSKTCVITNKIDFPETQVVELSKVKDVKSVQDKIVTYNHISSDFSNETRFCRLHIPFPKNEKRIPRDLDYLFSNGKLEMHEFKHVKEIPHLLKLINYKLYYSHVTKLSFLHTMEDIPHKYNIERINNELLLDLYRSILDKDMDSVHEQLKRICSDYLKKSQVDLKRDFNIDLTEYSITSTNKKQQVEDLMKNDYFVGKLYNNFHNFISSIDFTNKDNINEEQLRTIQMTTSDEYKSLSFNRLIPIKLSTVFDSFVVQNNKTLDTPFYPAYGLYPCKHFFFQNLTNSIVSKQLNTHFDSLCLNSKQCVNIHHESVKIFKKLLYIKK